LSGGKRKKEGLESSREKGMKKAPNISYWTQKVEGEKTGDWNHFPATAMLVEPILAVIVETLKPVSWSV